jgi:hypothetical protein
MYREIGAIDACVSVAASGAPDTFQNLTEAELLENMRGKLFGQILCCSARRTWRTADRSP